MRMIVTGVTGFVGRHLRKHATAQSTSVVGTWFTRAPTDGGNVQRLDVTDADAVRRLVKEVRPDVIVNAAAALSGTLASSAGWAVNAQGAVNVARAAREYGVRLVHVSSDAIFSGRPQPYTEEDLPEPIYPYGAAKAAAELAIAEVCPAAVIARPSLITGDGDELSRRERHMLALAAGEIDGVYFSDEVRCPVGVNDFAKACLELATTDHSGVLNVTGPEAITLYDFACVIAQRHGCDSLNIRKSTHKEAAVTRPGCVILDTTAARALLSTRLRGVDEIVTRPS